MNGGSTFLIRTCKELAKRKVNCKVLILRTEFDSSLLAELENYATILFLKDFLVDKGTIFRNHVGIFGWVDWKKLIISLSNSGDHIHIMGVFGLIFANRLVKHFKGTFISAGVYHQNEFLYKSKGFYFPKKSQELFKLISPENIVFFNDSSRKNYEHFFCCDYSKSKIVPIGIELDDYKKPSPLKDIYRIVSVGNLVEFKTYNEHMINIISKLIPQYPNLKYDIYGDGPNKKKLEQLVIKLNLNNHIHFHGCIPYDEFQSTIFGAGLFVGSGTALIEAAAMGIPALIGIESIETAETYGFISDIKDLSYNENILYIKKIKMIDVIEKILNNNEYRSFVSDSCLIKAKEFSVASTVNGFLSITDTESKPDKSISNIRMLFSLCFMALFEKTRLVNSFSERRNESYL